MLTLYTKERLSRPSLSVVDSQQYKEVKLTALDKLKTLKPGELELEEDDSGSDITDPFEDVRDEIDQGFQKAKKKLTRLEKSLQLMKSFSEDFKKAMEETREELKLDSEMYYEDIDQITDSLKQTLLSKNLSQSKQEKLNSIFSESNDFLCGPDLGIPDPEDPTNPPASAESQADAGDTTSECDVMSGMWNMLATSKGLIASPPFYNAYRQQTPHWLDRDGPSWVSLDEAKEKCVTWLQKVEEGGETQKRKVK